MKKGERSYLIIFLVTCTFVVWATANTEEDPWKVTFEQNDTKAYGSKVLYELLPYIIDNKEVISVNSPPFELAMDTTLRSTNYLFITRVFKPDDAEADGLFEYVARGNMMFIAAEEYRGNLPSKLGIDSHVHFGGGVGDSEEFSGFSVLDTIRVNFVNQKIASDKGYFYSTDLTYSQISTASDSLEASDITILGEFQRGGSNFVKINVGKGFFLLSTVPLAFTNYNLLMEGNAEYAYSALSYLPAQPTFWDRHYKPNRSLQSTPLQYVMTSKAFRTAYYLILGSIILFMLTRARRKQRVIPVLSPKQNTTVEFAHTVGRLYFNEGDHSNLAHKMLDQFKQYVHRRLHLPGKGLAALSAEQIGARTGLETDQVAKLLSQLVEVETGKKIDADALRLLAFQLDVFYTHSKR